MIFIDIVVLMVWWLAYSLVVFAYIYVPVLAGDKELSTVGEIVCLPMYPLVYLGYLIFSRLSNLDNIFYK